MSHSNSKHPGVCVNTTAVLLHVNELLQQYQALSTMGADQSCPCNGDSNVDFPPDDEEVEAIVVAKKVPESPTSTSRAAAGGTTDRTKNKSPAGTPVSKSKSRKWAAQPKDASDVDVSITTTQVSLVWVRAGYVTDRGAPGFCLLQPAERTVVWYNMIYMIRHHAS